VITYNKFYARMLKPFAKQVVVSPGGCNIPIKLPEPQHKENIFLMMARCDDYLKGLHVLIRAVDILSKKREDFKVLITHKDTTFQLPPFIENLGWLPPQQLKKYIKKALATIHPSIWPEPFGMAALESAALGTPVLASDVGGLGDFVRATESGWLFKPADYERLASLMLSLLKAPSSSRISAKTFSRIKNYNWNRIFHNCYHPLLENG
jgi:glycogen(starch) synthase